MTERALRYLERISKSSVLTLAFLLVFLVGLSDFVTRLELHLNFLYLLPIALVSWFVGRQSSIYVCVLCALLWFAAGRAAGEHYSSAFIEYWNLIMRAAVFLMVALTLSQLRSKFEKMSEMASRDFLTGLPNGHSFYELAAREMERALGLYPLTLAYIDIEGFKWINHRFGYAAGDQMLCSIAQTIRQNVPRADLVGRMGGTAFALLLPDTTSDAANLILAKIHKSLKEERGRYAQPVTFFISAIACTKAPRSVAELMHEAELRMNRMKGGNKDSLEIAHVDSMAALN